MPRSAKRLASMPRSAKESELIRNVEKKRKQQQESITPYLHEECISNILMRLPLDSLHRSIFVCKHWFNIVRSPSFVETHLHRSESVLIFTMPTRNFDPSPPHSSEFKTCSIEAEYILSAESLNLFPNFGSRSLLKPFVRFLEFRDGTSTLGEYGLSCYGQIRATCRGLILLDNKLKRGGLIVTNPVTRKLTALLPGTLSSSHKESYGFAYNYVSDRYIIVHLFFDTMMHTGCEIFTLGTKTWRAIDGPSFGLFGWLGYKPVEAIGALHWIPRVNHSDIIVSLEIESEKFKTIPLPNRSNIYDGIVEIGSFLSFVTHKVTHTNVWILKSLFEEVWIKQHCINFGIGMVPVLSLRIRGDLVFKSKDGSFYIYDFVLRLMSKVKEQNRFGISSDFIFPHVNSMVSWSNS